VLIDLYIAGKADPAFVIRASPGTSFIKQQLFPVAQKEGSRGDYSALSLIQQSGGTIARV
jgi:hypothetical protein